MKPIVMLACPPADKKQLEEIGIIHLDIGPNYVKGKCSLCDCDVWIGPTQKQLMENNPIQVHCFICAKKTAQSQRMSFVMPCAPGGGAKYIMKDGHIHAEGKD